MSVAGVGIDAVNIERFKKTVEKYGKNFLTKIFTEKELEYAKDKKAYAMHMSGKFAAKEAIKKALPDGAKIGLNWALIEILNGTDGKPYACLHGIAKQLMAENGISNVLISISHTKELAVSNAIGVKNV